MGGFGLMVCVWGKGGGFSYGKYCNYIFYYCLMLWTYIVHVYEINNIFSCLKSVHDILELGGGGWGVR